MITAEPNAAENIFRAVPKILPECSTPGISRPLVEPFGSEGEGLPFMALGTSLRGNSSTGVGNKSHEGFIFDTLGKRH